ncbi:hypothetical protein [Sphaerisporangium siamense]|uniref:hypothetical protein n=1 Tax=Sphaerisporangium siamense TaxID=795645 RepID=UPI001607B56F|nr:hypothetical protein [Sphaerisporangium siamense]
MWDRSSPVSPKEAVIAAFNRPRAVDSAPDMTILVALALMIFASSPARFCSLASRVESPADEITKPTRTASTISTAAAVTST